MPIRPCHAPKRAEFVPTDWLKKAPRPDGKVLFS
jgi:hypothetical protein